jgi:hypothetical protein
MNSSGNLPETSARESTAIDTDELETAREPGHYSVAALLAVAAVIAAAITARAFMFSNSADDAWQSSLRTEVKRSAAVMVDVRSLYQDELPVAVQILEARILAAEFEAAAESASGSAAQALRLQAEAEANMAGALSSNSQLASDGRYALPSGGFDLARRLADLRSQSPDLLALDPDALQSEGDNLANEAELLTLTLLPTSVGAFLGVMAQPLRRRRRWLLVAGWLALAAGVAMAVGVEVLA